MYSAFRLSLVWIALYSAVYVDKVRERRYSIYIKIVLSSNFRSKNM